MKNIRYYFYFDVIKRVLDALEKEQKEISISLDLNLTQHCFKLEKSCLTLFPGKSISREMLMSMEKSTRKIFIYDGTGFSPLEIRTHSYYKLVPTDHAPVLEIDGVKMHRSKGIAPFEDAQKKTSETVSPGDYVLDTCGGLAYSAFFALKAGAKQVTCVEKSREVMQLRELNPWFLWLQQNLGGIRSGHPPDSRVEFICSDVKTEIEKYAPSRFNSIIHDPPRFSSATGDLYGKVFYDALFRVLAPGGRLFHYTGSPKRIKNGNRFVQNTMRRLENSGFSKVFFQESLQGIHAVKQQ